jgi:hypothetical protein
MYDLLESWPGSVSGKSGFIANNRENNVAGLTNQSGKTHTNSLSKT